jgi:hypothetical protein
MAKVGEPNGVEGHLILRVCAEAPGDGIDMVIDRRARRIDCGSCSVMQR